jgi:hypothetical protein
MQQQNENGNCGLPSGDCLFALYVVTQQCLSKTVPAPSEVIGAGPVLSGIRRTLGLRTNMRSRTHPFLPFLSVDEKESPASAWAFNYFDSKENLLIKSV